MSGNYTKMAKDGDLASLTARVSANETAIGNKADKLTTYTKAEVDEKVAGVQTFRKLLVNALPSAESADDKAIYLVPRTGSETPDLCDEYVAVGEAGSRRWEKVGGGTAVDVTLDDAVTPTSAKGVASSGIWAAIWGALAALPSGVASLYDWCVAQLAGKQAALSEAQLAAANSGATAAKVATWDGYAAQISAKADAADLRYTLVVAPIATTYSVPDEWFPVSFTANGTSYTVPLADKAMIVVNMGYLEYHGPNGEFVSIAYFTDAMLSDIAPNVSDLQFNGVAPVKGETSLDATVTATLADRACSAVTRAATLTLPAAVPDHLRDLIVDVDNSAGAGDLGLELASDEVAYLDTGGAHYLVAVPEGDDLADLLTVAAGKRARLYFTETAQRATPTGGTSAVPVISLQRLTVTVGGAS